MKTQNCKKPALSMLQLVALQSLLALSCVHAFDINFNDYSLGNLDGQPADEAQKWSGGGADFQVVDGVGVAGSKAVLTSDKLSGTTGSLFSPGALLPEFDGASSILHVSFQFRYNEMPDANTNTVAAIQFGYDEADANTAARFYMRSDGRIGYSTSTGPSTLILQSVLQITDTSTWTKIDAVLNYETQMYSFYINDVLYATGGGTSDFAFRGPSEAPDIRLTNSGSANHKNIVFDNISASVIPETSTVAMLIMGMALLVIGKLKRVQR